MLGKRNPQEPLFYYFNMADMIPKNHILRLINKYVDFSFLPIGRQVFVTK